MDSSDAPPVDALFSATYCDLRALAHARLRFSSRDAMLDTTALVHESYERLCKAGELDFPDRARFLMYAGRVMRSIIIDYARQRQAERHGGDAVHVTFTARNESGALLGEDQILRVHEALDELERVDERMARVVEMRYFGGMTETQIAEALGVTDRTVRRDWGQARLFLADALK